MGERDTTIYPDGDELYFSMWERSHGYLLTRTDGPDGWSEPRFAEFSAPEHPELEPFITVDGSWLFFGAAREGDLGRGDMHIAFRGPDGDFLPAVNMGAPINSASLDYCPALSPDRTILFFTSNRVPDGSPQPTTYAELEAALTGAANGRDNIWWVSADVIERLRDRVLETG
jgi:hypothetical protein